MDRDGKDIQKVCKIDQELEDAGERRGREARKVTVRITRGVGSPGTEYAELCCDAVRGSRCEDDLLGHLTELRDSVLVTLVPDGAPDSDLVNLVSLGADPFIEKKRCLNMHTRTKSLVSTIDSLLVNNTLIASKL
jgi:hypothetical protein